MNTADQTISSLDALAQEQFSALQPNDILQHHTPDMDALIFALSLDSRKGVQKIGKAYQSKLDKLRAELLRIEALVNFDRSYHASMLAGVDEVGRGPLAGPVVAGCVIMDLNHPIAGVNDSKKLSKQRREELYEEIVAKSLYCAIGISDNHTIDRTNILNATFAAMNSAIEHIQKELLPHQKSIDLILVDGNQRIREQTLPQSTVIGGDARSYSIACASILAKVHRDRLMEQMDARYPGYDFASNAGYGAPAHLAGIQTLGLSPIHRKTFCTKL